MSRCRIAAASESEVLSVTGRRALRPDLVDRRTSARDYPNSFSALLRLWRYESGLTLKEVASAVGVSRPTVWGWEKGKARPGREKWHAIAKVLGVAPDVLVSAARGSALIDLFSSDVEAEGQDRDALIARGRAIIANAYRVPPSAVRIYVEV